MLNLCSRGILLERGKMVDDNAIESVIRQYLKGLRIATPWDLSSYNDRQGNGRVRFTRVRFEDELGNTVNQAIAGQPLVIALDYQSAENQELPNCLASVVFYDGLGQVLFNCATSLAHRDPVTLRPVGTIRCVIPKLPLSQNQYLLTLFLEVNREIEDWLSNAIELDVIDGDFYGSGRLYPEGWRGKGVLVPHQWIIDGN